MNTLGDFMKWLNLASCLEGCVMDCLGCVLWLDMLQQCTGRASGMYHEIDPAVMDMPMSEFFAAHPDLESRVNIALLLLEGRNKP